jgi:nucleotide-binding universal stress UspA family protein
MPTGWTPPDLDTPVLRDVSASVDVPEPAPAPPEPPLRLSVAPAPHQAPVPLRRPHPWLLVVDDETPATYAALTWALREAARREATVVAVAVTDAPDGSRDRRADLDARVGLAVAETGSSAQVQTAVLDAAVLAALTGAARGADLVVVGAVGKTLLRPAVSRTAARRLARGA